MNESGISRRPVIFGEVLFDRFPDGSNVLGGAPFNVAWHLQAFGQVPLFISSVGKDALGEQIQLMMQQWGMDTSGLQIDEAHPTGVVDIVFEGGEPHYDIVKPSAYDFISGDQFPLINNASIIYHGSLAMRNETSAHAFQSLLDACHAPRFLDVNLRTPWWNTEQVLKLMSDSDWLKLNIDELGLLQAEEGDSQQSARHLIERYSLDTVILTRGSEGADLITSSEIYNVMPEATTEVVDTVGAGDAFTSVILLGYLLGWQPETMLKRAQQFASAIVGIRGATVTDLNFYQQFKKGWDL